MNQRLSWFIGRITSFLKYIEGYVDTLCSAIFIVFPPFLEKGYGVAVPALTPATHRGIEQQINFYFVFPGNNISSCSTCFLSLPLNESSLNLHILQFHLIF